MIYFTADLHFYHEKIIAHAKRPFRSAEEMDQALIQRWNSRVSFDDEVYILGDVTMKGAALAMECLSALRGKKHLIRGNHDRFVDSPNFEPSLFASIQHYGELTYQNTRFILFHYPIAEWNGFYRGAVHLHGHQHNHGDYNLNQREAGLLRYDVGVDANNMEPVSAEEILRFFAGGGAD